MLQSVFGISIFKRSANPFTSYLSTLYDLDIRPQLTGSADRVYPDDVLVRYEPRGRGLLIHHGREALSHP